MSNTKNEGEQPKEKKLYGAAAANHAKKQAGEKVKAPAKKAEEKKVHAPDPHY
jgi:hypothetical protein